MGSSNYRSATGSGLLQALRAKTPRSSVERRPKGRKRLLLTGIGVFSDGTTKFDCTIRDISETGARIGIPRDTLCPSDFFLINVSDRVAYLARIVWVRNSEVGLSFNGAISLTELADRSLAFLKRHWLERAAR